MTKMELVIVFRTGYGFNSESEIRYRVRSQRMARWFVRKAIAMGLFDTFGTITRAYTLDGWQVRWSRNFK